MRRGIPSWDKVESSAEALQRVDDARVETGPIGDAAGETESTTPLLNAHDDGHEPDAVTDEIPIYKEHRKAPVGLIVTIAVMSVLLIGISTLAAYLWHVAEAWEKQVADITVVSYDLGDEVAAARDSLTVAHESIALLEDQLATAKDSVTRLQAENAQWGDDAAFAQETISTLETRIGEGVTVSTSLVRCIEAHDQLLTYLDALEDAATNPTPAPTGDGETGAEPVAPEEVASYQQSVEDLCSAARTASQTFQQSVTE